MKFANEPAIKKILSPQKLVNTAFVFGSEAKNRAKEASDIDIALLLSKLPSSHDRLELRTTVANKLNKVSNREIDVVILNNAGSLLKYQVARDGLLVFERKKGIAKKFRLSAVKEFFDYLPTFNFHYERQKKRKLHG